MCTLAAAVESPLMASDQGALCFLACMRYLICKDTLCSWLARGAFSPSLWLRVAARSPAASACSLHTALGKAQPGSASTRDKEDGVDHVLHPRRSVQAAWRTRRTPRRCARHSPPLARSRTCRCPWTPKAVRALPFFWVLSSIRFLSRLWDEVSRCGCFLDHQHPRPPQRWPPRVWLCRVCAAGRCGSCDGQHGQCGRCRVLRDGPPPRASPAEAHPSAPARALQHESELYGRTLKVNTARPMRATNMNKPSEMMPAAGAGGFLGSRLQLSSAVAASVCHPVLARTLMRVLPSPFSLGDGRVAEGARGRGRQGRPGHHHGGVHTASARGRRYGRAWACLLVAIVSRGRVAQCRRGPFNAFTLPHFTPARSQGGGHGKAWRGRGQRGNGDVARLRLAPRRDPPPALAAHVHTPAFLRPRGRAHPRASGRGRKTPRCTWTLTLPTSRRGGSSLSCARTWCPRRPRTFASSARTRPALASRAAPFTASSPVRDSGMAEGEKG